MAGACHRDRAFPRLAEAAAHLRALADAAKRVAGDDGRRPAHRHGVLARMRHPLRQPGRCRDDRDDPRPGRRDRQLGRPGAGGGGTMDAAAAGGTSPVCRRAAAHQGRDLRLRRVCPARRYAHHRVQRAAVDDAAHRRGRACGRPSAAGGGQCAQRRSSLHPYRPAPRRDRAG